MITLGSSAQRARPSTENSTTPVSRFDVIELAQSLYLFHTWNWTFGGAAQVLTALVRAVTQLERQGGRT
jgi:hypothetical protein